MKSITILIILITSSCSFKKERVCNILELKEISKIEASLNSDKKVYKLGEAPKIKSIIKNIGDQSIVLIHALDGSNDSSRYPILKFHIYRNDTLLENKGFRCGNLDGIPFDAFISLKAGESFDPNLSAPSVYREHLLDSTTFQSRGKYKINFYYCTNQDTLDNWIGLLFMSP